MSKVATIKGYSIDKKASKQRGRCPNSTKTLSLHNKESYSGLIALKVNSLVNYHLNYLKTDYKRIKVIN